MIAVRAARAEDVAEDVRVEAQDREKACSPAMGRQRKCHDGDKSRESDVVGEDMVILRPPQERMRGIAGRDFDKKTESVDIRDYCGGCDDDPFAIGQL